MAGGPRAQPYASLSSVQVAHAKNGCTYYRNRYVCCRCHRTLSSDAVPASVCPGYSGKVWTVQRRAQVWKQCRAQASRDVAGRKGSAPPGDAPDSSSKKRALSEDASGTSSVKRGYREQRIGEAQNSGPRCGRELKMWSQNIRSWHANGLACLGRAQREEVSLVALQEMNARSGGVPGVVNTCQRFGWQMLLAPAPSGSTNQGVLLCVAASHFECC